MESMTDWIQNELNLLQQRWDGKGCWGGFQEKRDICTYLWPIHVDAWQKPSQYGKVIIL